MSKELEAVFSAWAVQDASERLTIIAENTAEPFYYVDPHAPEALRDIAGFNAFLQMFTDNMPGASAKVVESDGHHGHLRATVDFLRDGARMMRGQYFAETNAQGKITRLVGFVGTGEAA